jgi:four helix bundle protein
MLLCGYVIVGVGMGYCSFEDLDVWKKSCRLTVSLYNQMKNCRDYSFKDQMCRAAVSIASNIAEGAERDSKQEYIRFLHIAKGSAAELRTQLYIAGEIKILDKAAVQEMTSELKHISAMLQKAATTIKSRIPT